MSLNSRILAYNIASSIGYSFVLTIIMAIVSLISKAFYPPFPFSIAPVILLVIAPVEGIIQIIILLILVFFAFPVRTSTEREQLLQIRKLAIISALGYLAFSLLPYAFIVPYIQTYVGLVIAFNIINGAFSGFITSIIH
ncbi:MAG: hypothetical protein QW281_02215 [Saccharolobus sp.]